MNTQVVKESALRAINRAGLKVKKYSPEILITVGVVAVGAGFVMGCKATLRAHEVKDKYEDDCDAIEQIHQQVIDETIPESEYPEDIYKKDKALAVVQMTWGYIKLYGPAVSLTVGGVGCFLAAYGILHKRNVALMAAYNALEKAFSEYRNRVIDDQGKEANERYLYGFEKVEQKGKKKDDEPQVRTLSGTPMQPSPYAKFFDESSNEWVRNAEANLMTLHSRQAWANEKLKVQGHLFLNEVYDMLGLQRTQAGSVVGWIYGGDGDDYIDFGIYEVNRPKNRDFVNGYEYSILLDFNVDGVIYDKI